MKISPSEALKKLGQVDGPFVTLFEHGTLSVEIYKPDKIDLQSPHDRDEVYVVVSGTGKFQNNGIEHRVGPGDFLFVKAHHPHKFVDFTDDFATWVLFYGPQGGESDKK